MNITDFETYKYERYIPKSKKRKAFKINTVTRLNDLVAPLDWQGIDVLYCKDKKLLGIREGEGLKPAKRRVDRKDPARNFSFKGVMTAFNIKPSTWVFKETFENIDIYTEEPKYKVLT